MQNKIFWIVLGLIAAGLCYLLAPILTPFLAGALLAYLCDPLVEKLVHLRLPRLVSVILVFLSLILFVVLFIFLLIPILEKQITLLINAIPDALNWIHNKVLPWVNQTFNIEQELNVETIKTTVANNLSKAGGIVTWVFATVLHSGKTLIIWITNLLLIPVVTFYLLRDWNIIIANFRILLPRHIEPVAVQLAQECNETLGSFFRGQLLVMMSLGIIYSLGLTFMGLKLGVIIGLIAGLVSIVPYLGFIVGIISASVAAYVQFDTVNSVLLVWGIFAIGQTIEGSILTPKLVGDRIGLHPVAVIFSVLAGGMLFGFFGVLLALPMAAVIMVWLRFLNQRYLASQLYR